MTKSYEARIAIKAPKHTVWAILTNAGAYPEWNHTIDKLEGVIAPGEKLKIWAKLSPKRAFPAKVSTFDPDTRMVWSFRGPLGMFTGARTFTLSEANGVTEFHTREQFGGWLAGPITKRMPDLQPSFDEWARCLKARAEAA